MKLVRLNNMCLTETCNEIYIGKNVLIPFLLKRSETEMPCSTAFEYALRKTCRTEIKWDSSASDVC
jgi:hypothetical protein